MKKFKCNVCGYIYDEANGDPKGHVLPGTEWKDVPKDWLCPVCKADKSAFTEVVPEKIVETKVVSSNDEPRKLSDSELSVTYSNLSKSCRNQYKEEEQSLFMELSKYYENRVKLPENKNLSDLIELLKKDSEENYKNSNQIVVENRDSGALRALTWGEKSTFNMLSLLNRYKEEKESLLENNDIYLCEICGFIYLGTESPENCPVCKVPKLKIEKVTEEVK